MFSQEEIRKCKEAMAKPGPLEALSLLASGRMTIELTKDKRDVVIDTLDGAPLRDPEFPERKMGLSGAWPLYRAGMIDDAGGVTELGYRTLQETIE